MRKSPKRRDEIITGMGAEIDRIRSNLHGKTTRRQRAERVKGDKPCSKCGELWRWARTRSLVCHGPGDCRNVKAPKIRSTALKAADLDKAPSLRTFGL